MNYLIRIALVISIVFLIQGCDLDLQRSFDFDEDDHPPIIEPYSISIWEYMTQKGEYDHNSELDSMVVAVERAGMVELYSGGEDDKTVLFLWNEAIMNFLNDHGYGSVDEVPVQVLQNMLRYHIISERVTQSDFNVGEYTVFQTLIEGENGLINFRKQREYWIIHINDSGGPNLPETSKGSTVYLHNFEFTNGAGHHLRDYVRRVPF